MWKVHSGSTVLDPVLYVLMEETEDRRLNSSVGRASAS